MKKTTLPLLFFLLAFRLPAQDTIPEIIDYFPEPCVPHFPGGEQRLREFLKEKLRYPVNTSKEGLVVIQFRVDTAGLIQEPRVMKAIDGAPEFSAEALRVVGLMPAWEFDDDCRKRKMQAKFNLPFRFRSPVKVTSRFTPPDTLHNWLDSAALAMGDSVFLYARQMPRFPGGNDSLRVLLAQTKKHPYLFQTVSGTVVVQFIVEKDGSLSHAQVIRPVPAAPRLSQEALRLLSLMPPWEPAKAGGKAVRSYVRLPVRFDPH